MSFVERLRQRLEKTNSLVCVGLDSDASKLPTGYDQLSFNKAIIDATSDIVFAYKPNTAFYEAQGAKGIESLKQTCEYIRKKDPESVIILDAKRADIGNTNLGYVDFAYKYLDTDAITLHPYLGREALSLFLDISDKGSIILCRTSNAGSSEFQDDTFMRVASSVSQSWNQKGNCMLVVGATYPEEIAKVRQIVGDDMWFLVPGIGAQGGDLQKTLSGGLTRNNDGVIINSSRGIIFASSGDDFADAARQKTIELNQQINDYRQGGVS